MGFDQALKKGILCWNFAGSFLDAAWQTAAELEVLPAARIEIELNMKSLQYTGFVVLMAYLVIYIDRVIVRNHGGPFFSNTGPEMLI